MTLNRLHLKYELLLAIVLTFLLWFIIFIVSPYPFWLMMSIAVIILNIYSFIMRGIGIFPRKISKEDIIWGVISALLLYFIFLLGFIIISQFYSSFSNNIGQVYQLKHNYNDYYLIFILLFIIGPGEEIFWRGFLQQELQQIFQPITGFFLTTLVYSLVHLLTGNIGLILAATVAGFFWGALYLWKNSLTMLIISHSLWDIFILILLPLLE